MKKRLFVTVFIFVSILLTAGTFPPFLLHAQKKTSRKALVKQMAPRFRQWLDLTHHIITPMEKNTFFDLTNDRDRDAFITLFWNLRDPSKGTPQNEFKDEHIKRFQYADRYFGYTSPLPGWKTDRGKIYILLGPPVSKNAINHNNLYPVEIWDYFGGPAKGLPTAFHMVFYRPHGGTDYRIYIPAVDGPAALLRTEIANLDIHDYFKVYEKIHELEPQVALVSMSLIPGENRGLLRPSLQDPILVSKIYDLPKRRINATYARNFMKFKGVVETSVTTDYINIKSDVVTFKDPLLGLHFAHLSLLPERISVDYSEDRDKYYFNFTLLVILKKGETVILQYNKDFPFYYTKEELDTQLSHGIVITDYFPVIEGNYRLSVVLQNSVNKELSYYETPLAVEAASADRTRVFGPLVSYRVAPSPRVLYSAFNILGNTVKSDPRSLFGQKEPITALFCVAKGNENKEVRVELTVESQDESRPYRKVYPLAFPGGKTDWCFTRRLDPMVHGHYALSVRVSDPAGRVLDSRRKEFQVSPMAHVAHPPQASKTLKPENRFLFYMTAAGQYGKTNNPLKAETYYDKALGLNHTFPVLVKSYASFLLEQKKYDKLLRVIEPLKGHPKEAFYYFSYKGRALYHKKETDAAVDALLEANKIYDSDIPVLNTLGLALIRMGRKDEALKALSASLTVNPHQESIKKIIGQLKEENGGKTK